MSSFNKVILMGNLGRDPELRYTSNDTPVCSFSMAMSRKWDGKEEVTWVDVTIWGKRAEAFHQYHSKGSSAFVEGRLRQDSWEDKKTGAKRSKLTVVGDSWEFVNGGQPEHAPAPTQGLPERADANLYGRGSGVDEAEPDEDTPF